MRYHKSRRRPTYQRKGPKPPNLPELSELTKLPPSKIQKQIEKVERELAKHLEAAKINSFRKWTYEKKLNIWREWSEQCRRHNSPISQEIEAIRKADLSSNEKFWSSNSIDAYRRRNRSRFYGNEPSSQIGVLSQVFARYRPPRVYFLSLKLGNIVARAFVDREVSLATAAWWADLEGAKFVPFGTELTPEANERILHLSASLQHPPDSPTKDEEKILGLLGWVALGNRQAKLARLQEGLALSEKIWLESANKGEAIQRIDKILARNRRKQALRMKSLLEGQFQFTFDCPYCGEGLGDDAEIDHIYPISRGGLSTDDNMVIVCWSCNNSKSDMTLRQFIAKTKLDRDKVEKLLEKLGKTV
ncbi:HNH endonuclease [Stieleria sp. ICT_E10.1]|uniref:HNH endonuclease n=1 Tax=Stieleria sedimenti TaxID=2976331 RepID=UPI00217F68AC|nr:HNH endonuclease [Stieleria sedimenti]MCS7466417.1 HNH endonuclease [Stieleria sedimenti]